MFDCGRDHAQKCGRDYVMQQHAQRRVLHACGINGKGEGGSVQAAAASAIAGEALAYGIHPDTIIHTCADIFVDNQLSTSGYLDIFVDKVSHLSTNPLIHKSTYPQMWVCG